MKVRIRTILAAIGALALVSTLSGCIFCEGGGREGRGGHCAAPVRAPICNPHWAYGGHR